MGCCVVIKKDKFIGRDVIIELEENEKNDLIIYSDELYRDNVEISNKVNNINHGEITPKPIEENNIVNTKEVNREKLISNNSDKRIKHTVRNLREITFSEVKNIHKFF